MLALQLLEARGKMLRELFVGANNARGPRGKTNDGTGDPAARRWADFATGVARVARPAKQDGAATGPVGGRMDFLNDWIPMVQEIY